MRVLLLGDSHTHGSYGSALEALFKKAGHQVTRVGWVSANAGHYLNGSYKKLKLGHTGDFDSDVKGKSFDIAVVSLGTNDAAGTNSESTARAAVSKIKLLADSIKANKVYWVGPPSFHPESAVRYSAVFANDDLNKKSARVWDAGRSVFQNAIDPRAATAAFVGTMAPTKKMPNGDIHFQKAGGAAWAKFVFDSIGGKALPATTTLVPAGGKSSAPVASKGGFPVGLAIGALAVVAGVLYFRKRIAR